MYFVQADCVNGSFTNISCSGRFGCAEPSEAVMPTVRDNPVKRSAISVGAVDFRKIPFKIDEYNVVPAFFLINDLPSDQFLDSSVRYAAAF